MYAAEAPPRWQRLGSKAPKGQAPSLKAAQTKSFGEAADATIEAARPLAKGQKCVGARLLPALPTAPPLACPPAHLTPSWQAAR